MRGIAKSGQNPHTLHGAVRTRRAVASGKPGIAPALGDPQRIPAKLRAVRVRRTRTRRSYLRRESRVVTLILVGIDCFVAFGAVFR